MKNNYKFFQNSNCEYFPCHELNDQHSLNCLFCYCPLYVLKNKCGGDFVYTKGIKDCSKCLIPHRKEGYEHVMNKIGNIIEIAKL